MCKLFIRKKMTLENKNLLAISILENIVDSGCIVKENKLICSAGEALTRSLYNKSDEDLAIALTKFEKGAVSTRHFHKNPIIEHVIIITGKCLVEFYDEHGINVISNTTVKTGESVTIPSGLIHQFTFPEYSEVIAITIPRDETFPT